MKINIFAAIACMFGGLIFTLLGMAALFIIIFIPIGIIDFTFNSNIIDHIIDFRYDRPILGGCMLLGMIVGFFIGLFNND